MKRATRNSLLSLVESYFQDYLRRMSGVSVHTMRAFQDGLRLFFTFLAERTGRQIDRLELDDIREEAVLAFLDHIESVRHNTPRTRNCRLAALRSFVRHLLRHDIARAEQYRRILALPAKRAQSRPIAYLEPEEMRVVLAQPDRRRPDEVRDHALILLLYNSGARIAEALGLRTCDLTLVRPFSVRLHGKGGKDRICPIWGETAAALREHLRRGECSEDGLVFRNARGGQLTRDGAAYILKKQVDRAAQKLPSLRRRRVTPHVLRHSCAVGMLQSGNELVAIRDFLGHASVATTGIYTRTNLRMKREVLSTFWKRAGLDVRSHRPWRPTPKLLALLTSL